MQHEFSSIPGMVEDITDLVLNLKLLVVKNHSEQSRTIRIERDRRGVVTGADIIHDESIEVINPDHILCTLTDDVPFVIDMTVENGRGYRTAAEGHNDDLEVGGIPIDAMFSPVRRVEYTVENTRVGQRTNYDKLVMKIWTTDNLEPGDGQGRRRRRSSASTSTRSSSTTSPAPASRPTAPRPSGSATSTSTPSSSASST